VDVAFNGNRGKCVSLSSVKNYIDLIHRQKCSTLVHQLSLITQNDVVVVTRTVVQVEASISRLAESELCRKSLPVELVVHFTVHIDVAAQEIRSGDNLCIRGQDTISDVQTAQNFVLKIDGDERYLCAANCNSTAEEGNNMLSRVIFS